MTVNYKGQDADFQYRIAEISFSEEDFKKIERIAKVMEIKGWNIDIVTDCYAQCEVSDKEEFKYFMQDWKAVKRMIANCEKYGF